MKKYFVIHPLLFAVFPVLFLFSHNIEDVLYSDTLLPIVIVLSFTSLLLLLSKSVLKNYEKAGILISFLLATLFAYGCTFDITAGCNIGSLVIGRHRYLLPFWAMITICGTYLIIKIRKDLHKLTIFLNIMAFSLIVISLMNIGAHELKTKVWKGKNVKNITVQTNNSIKLANTPNLPDIYYIIPDTYGNSNTLKELYGYDNHEFMDYLIEKGFYIASKSRCNYPSTLLSLASSLNMEYVNYLSDAADPYGEATKTTENNKVMNLVKSIGYKYITVGYYINKNADLIFNYKNRNSAVNEYHWALINMTPLGPFSRRYKYCTQRVRYHYNISKLAEIPEIDGPKFTIVHTDPPHPPYIFGRNGEAVLPVSGKVNINLERESFVNQLVFVNKKLKIVVDEILSKSNPPPIIVIQGDHGTYSLLGHTSGPNWDHPTDDMVRERMRIFNAYYLPAECKKTLYDSITPVNTFRLIFNCYFGADFELLEDRCYFSSYNHLFKFRDVTGIAQFN